MTGAEVNFSRTTVGREAFPPYFRLQQTNGRDRADLCHQYA